MNIKVKHLILLFGIIFINIVHPLPGYSQSWGTKNHPVHRKDYTPHHSTKESFSERYTFSAKFDNGDSVGIEFSVSNLGFGDKNAIVVVEYKNSKSPKESYKYNKNFSEDEWSSDNKKFQIKAGPTTITSPSSGVFHITHQGKVPIDVKFENTTKMWKPGNGRIQLKDGYYQLNIISPQSKVVGTINQKKVQSQFGYADHVVTDIAPYSLAKSFGRARIYDNGMMILWRDIRLDHNNKHIPWVLILYKNKIIFSSTDVDIRYGSTYVDGVSGYNVPKSLQLDARSGKDRVKLIMRADKMDRRDLLDGYSGFVKTIASAFAKPYTFIGHGQYQMELVVAGAKAKMGNKAEYTLDFVNK